MQAENLTVRRQMIRRFALAYASFLLAGAFYCFWAFMQIPAIQRRAQLQDTEEIQAFLRRTREANELTAQIQAKPRVSQRSMLAFYEWIGQQKATYPRPAARAVLQNYQERVAEIERSRRADTTLAALQRRYLTISAETRQLAQENEGMEEKLNRLKMEAKSQE